MEPLTTQTFDGDETQAPLPPPEAATPDGTSTVTSAVPFRDFGISEAICSGLEAAGIFTTFPIQALTLPLALAGQDIIGQARTGTGKTLAFVLPVLESLVKQGSQRKPAGIHALILSPTRELAQPRRFRGR